MLRVLLADSSLLLYVKVIFGQIFFKHNCKRVYIVENWFLMVDLRWAKFCQVTT